MIILYLSLAVVYLRAMLKKLHKTARSNIRWCIALATIGMVAYELYVEYAVGWKYGVPLDDDSRWLFLSCKALKNGTKVSELYLLISNAAWDKTGRALSFSNLGQYLYLFFAYAGLYFPTFFSIRINLYLLYLVQILFASAATIESCIAMDRMCADVCRCRRCPRSWFFFLTLFYPVVLFNTYKLLRESIFAVLSMKVLIAFIQAKENKKKRKNLILYSLCLVLIRPNVVVLVAILLIWVLFGERMALMSGMGMSLVLALGSIIVTRVARFLGWGYSIGLVSLSEMIHLLLFPSPVSQIKNLLQIGLSPSWVTLLYFSQSVWNIPILAVCLRGILYAIKRKQHLVWAIIWLNSLMVYSSAYGISDMTPRYKLVFLIPQMVYLYIGLVRIRSAYVGERREDIRGEQRCSIYVNQSGLSL